MIGIDATEAFLEFARAEAYNWTLSRTILRRVDARTGIISTIGRPCGSFAIVDPPTNLCHLPLFSAFAPGDGDEIFVVADDHRIVRVDAATGALEHLAGRGERCNDFDGTSLQETCLGYFQDVARDAAGNLYFAEPDSGVVRRLDATDTRLEIVAGARRS